MVCHAMDNGHENTWEVIMWPNKCFYLFVEGFPYSVKARVQVSTCL